MTDHDQLEQEERPGDRNIGIDKEVVRDLLDGKGLGQMKGSGSSKWRCYNHLGARGIIYIFLYHRLQQIRKRKRGLTLLPSSWAATGGPGGHCLGFIGVLKAFTDCFFSLFVFVTAPTNFPDFWAAAPASKTDFVNQSTNVCTVSKRIKIKLFALQSKMLVKEWSGYPLHSCD